MTRNALLPTPRSSWAELGQRASELAHHQPHTLHG